MSAEPREDGGWEAYLALLTERSDLYARMEDAACEQIRALRGPGEPDPLASAQVQRDLQDRIADLDLRIEAASVGLDDDPVRQARRDGIQARTRATLERLLGLQEQALSAMSHEREAVAGRLRRIHAGRAAARAYAGTLRRGAGA